MSSTRPIHQLIDMLKADLMSTINTRGQVRTGKLSSRSSDSIDFAGLTHPVYSVMVQRNPNYFKFYRHTKTYYLPIEGDKYISTSHGNQPLTLVRMKNALKAVDDLEKCKKDDKLNDSQLIEKLRKIFTDSIEKNEELTLQYGKGEFHRSYQQAKLIETSMFFAWLKTSWNKSLFNTSFEDGLEKINKFCKINMITVAEEKESESTKLKPLSISS